MKIIYDDFVRYYQSFERIPQKAIIKKPNFFLLFKFLFISKGFRAVFFYRLLNSVKINKSKILKYLIFFLKNILINIEISNNAKIGSGLLIPHAQCIVIGGCNIGDNATIQQGVTIGANIAKIRNGRKYPIIGNNVLIGAGAKVLGPVIIGDNVIIGANSVIIKDVPENSIVVGVPGQIIGQIKESYPEYLEKIYKDT